MKYKLNIGIIIFVFAIFSAFLPPVNNLLPYLLTGIGISQLNNYWEIN